MFLRNAPEIPAGRKRKAPVCPSGEGSLAEGTFYPTQAYKDDNVRGHFEPVFEGLTGSAASSTQYSRASVKRELWKLEGGYRCFPMLIPLISLYLKILKILSLILFSRVCCFHDPVCYYVLYSSSDHSWKMGPRFQDKEASLVRLCHVGSESMILTGRLYNLHIASIWQPKKGPKHKDFREAQNRWRSSTLISELGIVGENLPASQIRLVQVMKKGSSLGSQIAMETKGVSLGPMELNDGN